MNYKYTKLINFLGQNNKDKLKFIYKLLEELKKNKRKEINFSKIFLKATKLPFKNIIIIPKIIGDKFFFEEKNIFDKNFYFIDSSKILYTKLIKMKNFIQITEKNFQIFKLLGGINFLK